MFSCEKDNLQPAHGQRFIFYVAVTQQIESKRLQESPQQDHGSAEQLTILKRTTRLLSTLLEFSFSSTFNRRVVRLDQFMQLRPRSANPAKALGGPVTKKPACAT